MKAYEYFLGIDPGMEGALAFVNSDRSEVLVYKIPLIKVETKRFYDCFGLVQLFETHRNKFASMLVCMEKVHSMPAQGVKSTFSTGYGSGLLIGILSALKLNYTMIEPSTWKRDLMNGLPKEKKASIVAATRLFPEHANSLVTGRTQDHNKADALLIAEWIRRSANNVVT